MNINQKRKIIYVITKGNWGGAQKYVFDLATSLPKDQFDVLVVHGEGNILNKKLQEENIRVEIIPEMGRDINILKEIITYFKLFKIFFDEKPDIVHVNSAKAGGIGAFIAQLYRLLTTNYRLKIIFTVHGWAFNEPQFNNVLTKFFSWLTVFLSTKTITISRQNLEQGLKFPFIKDKLVMIYNGVRSANFRDRSASRNFLSGITKAPIQKPWIATISELHKNKGLEYLIQAIGKMKKKPIVFIMGEGEERDNLEDLIERLGLRGNIYLMGFVENAISYLKAFDIFTLTSIKEGHPYAVLEAGLAKLPVLGSDIPGIRDIIKNNENGILVKSRSPEEISENLEELLSHPRKTAQLGHKLESDVREDFSFEKMLEKTIHLY